MKGALRHSTTFLRNRRRAAPFNRHRTYEQAKARWSADHPGATPAEYTAAMVRIARECGV